MDLKNTLQKWVHTFKSDTLNQDQMQAGTGFMACLSDAIRDFEKKGYSENLVAEYDHFRAQQISIYPEEFYVDQIVRFENSSDPDDQSILYAITSHEHGLKGLYVESYGLYHESLSSTMLDRIKFCQKNQEFTSA